jgi:multidrug efflux pump subunit AcrB
MSVLENFKEKFKEFKPTSWAVTNRTTVYLLILIVTIMGVQKFITLPKESFPEVKIPYVFVQTVYAGNTPMDIENLVTQPLEKQIKGITGVKIEKLTSTSYQDVSLIVIQFSTSVKIEDALPKVKDAIDQARKDLPTELTQEPTAMEFNLSEIPIMSVNVSGNYDPLQLKKYADDLKDRLEEIPQINRVDLVGAPEREFQVNVDNLKMQAAGITFNDIANAIKYENMDISGGQLEVGNMRRNLQLKGQIKTAYEIQNIVVRNSKGAPIYLKDIAAVKDTLKETESYARLNGKNVITLNIVKRSGENLIATADAVKELSEQVRKDRFPKDVFITISGDQSINTEASFNELINSIVIGFILVLVILMFFMGVTNAFFVALSVPLSMFVAFIFLPFGELIINNNITLNFMVLFALLFGLGIIVDDAIVVIENTHRIFTDGKGSLSSVTAAKMAAGEVFVPVLSGTLTTLAPFIPLMFWPGMIGKFMIYLPLMLIFTLSASLLVAFIMNPVFAVDFMNHRDDDHDHRGMRGKIFKTPSFIALVIGGILFDLMGIFSKTPPMIFIGNLALVIALLGVINAYFLEKWIHKFQHSALPWIMNHYENLLKWALKGWRPVHLLLGIIGFLVFVSVLFGISAATGRNKVVFFPNNEPNYVYVYLKLPVGTDVDYTNSVLLQLEKRVDSVLGKNNTLVESVIANVAVGASEQSIGAGGATQPQLGRIQVSFVPFEKRHGKSTTPYLDAIRTAIKGIPGAEITVDKERSGPPTDPPINIEVSSENFDNLASTAVALKNYLDSIGIEGVEELKMDIDLSSPEITMKVNRERALIAGISSAQIGQQIRSALYGLEASKIKEGDEEYKIQIRNSESERKNLTNLLNMNMVFRDAASGQFKSVPIVSLVDVDFTNTLGSVIRINQKRTITLKSALLSDYTAPAVNADIKKAIAQFHQKPDDVNITQTGEGEQQKETTGFLGGAFISAILLIVLILVWQFNSMGKATIILTEIIFSIVGVLLGFTIFGMTVSSVMVGVGILGLAGIVIKNGILVIEFADELRGRGMKIREAVIQAGKIRIIPVLLTAVAAITALFPLAVGFNINFYTMFSELNPRIFFGGSSVAFWGTLSWTIIFGLIVAFFLTLVMVPSMYLIYERLKRPMRKTFGGRWISFMGIPPFTFVFGIFMIISGYIQKCRVEKRRRKLENNSKVNEAFIGSWF